MKHVWHVTFDAKYTGLGDLQRETRTVIANGDGLAAVQKAKRLVIGRRFEDGPINGKWITRRCLWVKLTGLEMLQGIDA